MVSLDFRQKIVVGIPEEKLMRYPNLALKRNRATVSHHSLQTLEFKGLINSMPFTKPQGG